MKYLNSKLSLVLFIVLMALMSHLSIYGQQKSDIGHSFKGYASYYHAKFLGRKTASGELITKGEFTCAHKTLPFGTLIEVENTKTGRWVIVRVNDRGPFSRNRILDLSYEAAEQLGMIHHGVAHVKAKIVGFNGNLELLREGFNLDYYNCFFKKDEEEKTKIPYLPTESTGINTDI